MSVQPVREGRVSIPIIWEFEYKSNITLVESLTPRELEVFRLVANGYSSREIAAELSIDERTARTHTYFIMRKLNAKNRTHAVKIGYELGLFRHGEPATVEDALELVAHYTELARDLMREEKANL